MEESSYDREVKDTAAKTLKTLSNWWPPEGTEKTTASSTSDTFQRWPEGTEEPREMGVCYPIPGPRYMSKGQQHRYKCMMEVHPEKRGREWRQEMSRILSLNFEY